MPPALFLFQCDSSVLCVVYHFLSVYIVPNFIVCLFIGLIVCLVIGFNFLSSHRFYCLSSHRF